MRKKQLLRNELLLIAALALLVCVFFHEILLGGKTLKQTTLNPQALLTGPRGQETNKPAYFIAHSTDACLFEEGIYEFLHRSVQQGVFPFWNPHQGCGYSLLATPHVGMFWPLHFFHYILPNAYSWDAVILCRFFLAGLFMFWFMRELRMGRLASFASAACFMFSGPMVLLHYAFVNVDILIPLVLLSHERMIRSPSRRSGCLAAFVLALTFYAGHVEHIFLVNAFGILYFIFRLLTIRPGADIRRSLVCLFWGHSLGTGLSAAMLMPFLQNWFTEAWHTHSGTMGLRVEGQDAAWQTLITFLIPRFFQDGPVGLDFERPVWWGYLGMLPLSLAALALLRRQRQGLNYFFAAVFLLIFLKNHVDTPLVNWIGALPLVKYCRLFFHTTHFYAFAVAVLAGMGIRAVAARPRLFAQALAWTVPVFLFAAASCQRFPMGGRARTSTIVGLALLLILQIVLLFKDRERIRPRTAAGVLALLLGIELFLHVPRAYAKRFDSFPPVPAFSWMQQFKEPSRAYGIYWTLYPNTATGYGINDFGILEVILPQRFVNYINNYIINGYFSTNSPVSSFWVRPVTLSPMAKPFLDILNIRFTLAPAGYRTAENPGVIPDFLTLAYDEEMQIFVNPSAMPRAFIVHQAVFTPDPKTAVMLMLSLNERLRHIVVLRHPGDQEIAARLSGIPPDARSVAYVTAYSPNEVRVRASLKYPGFLVLGDSYHEDWQAFVDGKSSKVYLADELIRAVFLDAGDQEVVFRYRPLWLYRGIAVSSLSLFILLWILIPACRGIFPRRTRNNGIMTP